jgi:tRNA pseudouridine55 synthase
MDGIVNINKPTGITSHDIVAQVRRITRQHRVGHTGTLDPLASGVLPICIGQATRIAEYLSEGGKTYRATITFGISTTTYDAEGEVVQSAPVHLTRADLEALLPAFLGKQQQLPPLYSAIKHHGQPLYKLARTGREVTLQPRLVIIDRLTILEWQSPTLTLEIECSKGTYIRSLAHDLGKRAGCGAHLSGLVRLRSGPFRLEDSISLETFARHCQENTWADVLYMPDEALLDYQAIIVGPRTEQRIRHGQGLTVTDLAPTPFSILWRNPNAKIARPSPASSASQAGTIADGPTAESYSAELPLLRAYTTDGRFIGILRWQPGSGQWHPDKVFDLTSVG